MASPGFLPANIFKALNTTNNSPRFDFIFSAAVREGAALNIGHMPMEETRGIAV